MKTIMLTGGAHLGKSTTLKHLYENYLLNDGSTQQIMREDVVNSLDFYATFKRNGKKIGICNVGDELRYIYANHQRAIDDKCDLYICANSLKLYGYRIIEADNSGIVLRKVALNNTDEKRVIDTIIYILNHEEVLG